MEDREGLKEARTTRHGSRRANTNTATAGHKRQQKCDSSDGLLKFEEPQGGAVKLHRGGRGGARGQSSETGG